MVARERKIERDIDSFRFTFKIHSLTSFALTLQTISTFVWERHQRLGYASAAQNIEPRMTKPCINYATNYTTQILNPELQKLGVDLMDFDPMWA